MRRHRLAGALGLALVPVSAHAHLAGVDLGDFWQGTLHPLLTPETIACFLATGLYAGQRGDRRGIRIVLLFTAGVAIGGVLGWAGTNGPWVTIADVASLVVMGGLVALAWDAPGWIALPLAAFFGATQGIDHGVEVIAPVAPFPFIAGVMFAAFLSTLNAMLLVMELEPPWTRIAVRVAGSWMAAIGLLVLALKLAR